MSSTPPAVSFSHEDVVATFNVLGYGATFAAVAERLGQGVTPAVLYDEYASREALGEAWLSNVVPGVDGETNVRSVFANLIYGIVEALNSQRDFSRAWLAALTVKAPLHLPQLERLHDVVRLYFKTTLTAIRDSISLPGGLELEDVIDELADLLSALAGALVHAWAVDRSEQAANTTSSIEASAILLDALLTRRADFGDEGLLVQLHKVLNLQHRQFVAPLLDIVLKPDRAGRLLDPQGIVQALHDLLPPRASAS
jgi:AcrR family transcriptional regulator